MQVQSSLYWKFKDQKKGGKKTFIVIAESQA